MLAPWVDLAPILALAQGFELFWSNWRRSFPAFSWSNLVIAPGVGQQPCCLAFSEGNLGGQWASPFAGISNAGAGAAQLPQAYRTAACYWFDQSSKIVRMDCCRCVETRAEA